jgi:hypothetical protein
MQSRTLSLIEAITSTFTGFFVSICIQLVLFPILGMDVSLSKNFLITSIFTIASILRGYAVRRLFNKIKSWKVNTKE